VNTSRLGCPTARRPTFVVDVAGRIKGSLVVLADSGSGGFLSGLVSGTIALDGPTGGLTIAASKYARSQSFAAER